MGKLSKGIRLAQILLYLNAVVWIILGIGTLFRIPQNNGESSIIFWIFAILMAGNAGMMLLSGWGLGTGRRLFYYLALIVMAVNIILTFTDQMGLIDFLTLAIDLVILALLIAYRRNISKTVQIG